MTADTARDPLPTNALRLQLTLLFQLIFFLKGCSKMTHFSDFLKPVRISTEMANFLGVFSDQRLSRVAVTKEIVCYIKQKDLQNDNDRRLIEPDAALRQLLKFDPNVEKKPLTYYELQKRIGKHYIRDVVAV